MSIFSDAFTRPRAEGNGDGFRGNYGWVSPEGFALEDGVSGIAVSATAIKQCGVVLAALSFLANSVAVCAPSVYRTNETSGKRTLVPKTHYLRRVLRKPNPKQSGFRWIGSSVWRAALYGNSYSEILPATLKTEPYSTAVGRLRPLNPKVTRIVDERESGELIYQTTRPGKGVERIQQDKMFHLRGVSEDGDSGEEIYKLMRMAVEIAKVAEKHTSTFLRKGSRLSGLLITSGPMTEDKRKELRQSINENNGGPDNTGTFGILPFGVEVKPIASSNRDGQLQEIREFQLGDILRFLRVPGIVVGYSEKTQGYGSAKEFYESGGLKHCVLPWIENFEAEIEFALVSEDDDIEVEFDMDVLTRPETWARIDSLTKAAGRPFMTGNEARVAQNMNPVEGDPSMDKVKDETPGGGFAAQNGGEKGGAPKKPGNKPKPDPAPSDDNEARRAAAAFKRVVMNSASMLVEHENNMVAAKAPKYASNQKGWVTWVEGFYATHADRVAVALDLPIDEAQLYSRTRQALILDKGIGCLETSQAEAVQYLTHLALREHSIAA